MDRDRDGDGGRDGAAGETDGVLDAVGPRLRALRRERGITLAELAATTGISESTHAPTAASEPGPASSPCAAPPCSPPAA